MYDWVLKKEGNTQQLRSQQMMEEKKAPIPGRVTNMQAAAAGGSAGLGAARASSKNL